MNVSAAVLDVLHQEGVSHLFLVPGAPIDPFLEQLAHSDRVRTIVAAHEAGAAFMADGYSRAGRRFGACLSIDGPGFTNTLTALATASADRSAVLAITGISKTQTRGQGAFQDLDSLGIPSQAIADAFKLPQITLKASHHTYHHLRRLLQTMLSPATRGPVQLSIPVDLQKTDVEGHWRPLAQQVYESRFLDYDSCDQFWPKAGAHTKIAILAGSGCAQSDANAALIQFAERYRIPVATTLGGKGVFPENHFLSLGVLGWFGHGPAINTLTSGTLDVLFVLGSRLNMLTSLGWSSGLRPYSALVVNDINSQGLLGDYPVDLSILGDARTCLTRLNNAPAALSEQLTASIEARQHWLDNLKVNGTLFNAPADYHSELEPIHPARALNVLRQVMPADTLFFSDSGAHGFFAGHYWQSNYPNQCFSTIKYMGSMGWAIPAAIGAKLARPQAPCVVVTGDGCMLMHGIEIQTAARYAVALICVVINNSALGNPKIRADKFSPEMGKLHELPSHDWAGFARSLGALGLTVITPSQLMPAFESALAANRAVVIDVRCGNYPTPTEAFDRQVTGKASHE